MSWIRFAARCLYMSSWSASMPHLRLGELASCSAVKYHLESSRARVPLLLLLPLDPLLALGPAPPAPDAIYRPGTISEDPSATEIGIFRWAIFTPYTFWSQLIMLMLLLQLKLFSLSRLSFKRKILIVFLLPKHCSLNLRKQKQHKSVRIIQVEKNKTSIESVLNRSNQILRARVTFLPHTPTLTQLLPVFWSLRDDDR